MPDLEEVEKSVKDIKARGLDMVKAKKVTEMTSEERDVLAKLATELEEGEKQLTELRGAEGNADKFRAAGTPNPNPSIYSGEGDPKPGQEFPDELLTLGERFSKSGAYKGWMEQYPQGGPSEGAWVAARSNSMEINNGEVRSMMGLATATEKLRSGLLTPERFRSMRQDPKFRALVTSADNSVGDLVRPDFRGLLEPGLVRPLTVRQLVTIIPVTTDTIEYVAEISRVNAAAPVAEATAMGPAVTAGSNLANVGVGGLKPEGGLVFDLRREAVRTLAEWVPCTRRALSDAPQVQTYINQYLTDDLATELEDQIVAGDGLGENFPGILNNTDINHIGLSGDGLDKFRRLRRAKRYIQVLGRTTPTAVLINPEDSEVLETERWGTSPTGPFTGWLGSGPFGYSPLSSVWGMTVVESEAVPAGTALVGDFRRAVLFDRESVNIAVGTAMDDFLRNIIRILAEMRAGFGVIRPKAFAAVDLSADPAGS